MRRFNSRIEVVQRVSYAVPANRWQGAGEQAPRQGDLEELGKGKEGEKKGSLQLACCVVVGAEASQAEAPCCMVFSTLQMTGCCRMNKAAAKRVVPHAQAEFLHRMQDYSAAAGKLDRDAA